MTSAHIENSIIILRENAGGYTAVSDAALEITDGGWLLTASSRCDFCHEPQPRWKYPANDVDLPCGSRSTGPWAACDKCRRLIDAKDLRELVDRAVRRNGLRRHKARIARTHLAFFNARTGGPTEAGSSTDPDPA